MSNINKQQKRDQEQLKRTAIKLLGLKSKQKRLFKGDSKVIKKMIELTSSYEALQDDKVQYKINRVLNEVIEIIKKYNFNENILDFFVFWYPCKGFDFTSTKILT